MIQKYITNTNSGSSRTPTPTINNPTNSNRTILKITNSNKLEPIMANAKYDENIEKVKSEGYRVGGIVGSTGLYMHLNYCYNVGNMQQSIANYKGAIARKYILL